MLDGPDLGLGPRLLVIETALRVLIDQASSTDPTLRDRIRQAAEAYLATVPHMTDLEREFTDRSRAFLESLVRPPSV